MLNANAYFDAALEILAKEGFPGLKQATVCKSLKVTTGSFYTHFTNWNDFTTQLLDKWQSERTVALVELASLKQDPIDRLDTLRAVSIQLPLKAEAAIRVWSMVDPEVAKVQREVDLRRLQILTKTMEQLFRSRAEAKRYAQVGVYLLVGHEMFEAETDPAMLDWALSQFLQTLKERRDR